MGSLCGGAKSAESAPVQKIIKQSTKPIPPQQHAIMNNQSKLIFSTVEAKEIIRSIKAETSNDSISLPQLKRAFKELKLSLDVLSDPDNITYKVVKKLKNEKKLYDVKLLSVLSVLIGKGSSEDKANWLFKQYDVNADGSLSKEEIIQLVDDLTKISIDIVPLVAKGEEAGQIQAEELHAYLESLKLQIEGLNEEIAGKILVDEGISETEFINKMMTEEFKLLLWSSGFRKHVRERGA